MRRIGLILAAGRSTRFGAGNKLSAILRDRPVAAHAAAAMRATPLDGRLVVLGDSALAELFAGFEILRPPPGCAQGCSLATGVARAAERGADRLLVTLADMPLAGPRLLARVLGRATDLSPSCASDGARRTPPACFPAICFPDLANIAEDRGAGRILGALPESALVTADPAELTDIDTPLDLARLEALLAGQPGGTDPGRSISAK